MAGQSRQALRTRIKSVQSTRKITKAMEMIANAKLFRQRARMESNREYSERLQDTVNEIAARNPDVECQYLVKNSSDRKMTVQCQYHENGKGNPEPGRSGLSDRDFSLYTVSGKRIPSSEQRTGIFRSADLSEIERCSYERN